VDALWQRLANLEPDDEKRPVSERRFLALAGVEAWSKIPKAVLPIMQRLLSEKEKAAARKGAS
jgi:hypothetical protein